MGENPVKHEVVLFSPSAPYFLNSPQ